MLNLIEMLKPENELEEAIVSNPQFIEGANYGKPRKGHPEGEVGHHIVEVLRNVDKYSTELNRGDLRIIALIHDTFKHKVDPNKSKDGENHHAMIARRFAESLNKSISTGILDIIELHDEAYNSWQKGARDGKWDKAEARLNRLFERLDMDANTAYQVELYKTFYKCDNETGDKNQDNYLWFIEQLKSAYND